MEEEEAEDKEEEMEKKQEDDPNPQAAPSPNLGGLRDVNVQESDYERYPLTQLNQRPGVQVKVKT